jgi:AraC family transcriptional regulator, transcriptional activator of pobA
MVESGQVNVIRQLTYRPPDAARAKVETMSFQTLRRLNDGATQRGDFHVLGIIRRGHGSVSADFSAHTLTPRSVVLIGPGVVHQWTDIAGLAGDIVLFVPTAPGPAARELVSGSAAAACWTAPDATWPLITAAVRHLRLETAPGVPARSPAGEIPGLLLSALLTRLDPPLAPGDSGNDVFRRFRASVEQQFREHHDVSHYARALGYAPRTLSRAAHAATGRSAKAYISERMLLEAKRLLAHDQLTPARCAQRLGFPDASNFSAFFLRESGVRPGAWQAAHR